ncbi:MAG: ABC transporter substrate-binding protein [Sporichthyaceae bacterium]
MSLPTRRLFRSAQALVAVAALSLLAACGQGAVAAPPASEPSAAPTAASPTAKYPVEPGAYPVYFKHTWGTTKIDKEPKRVVALGFRDQEALTTIGIKPLTIRNYFGAAAPWTSSPWLAEDVKAGPYQVVVSDVRDPKNGRVYPSDDGPILRTEFPQASNTPVWKEVYDLEAIKALKPDVITALYSGLTLEDYLKLKEIAPTITGVSADGRDYFSSWQEEMNAVGAVFGRPSVASDLIQQTQDRFGSVVDKNPEFRDAQIAVAAPGPNGQFRIINPYAPLARIFTSMGMDFPRQIESVTSPSGKAFRRAIYNVDLSTGAMGYLNGVDLLVFVVGTDGVAAMDRLKKTAAYQNLTAVKKGRVLELGPGLAEAAYYASPQSIPWLLDQIVPTMIPMLADKAGRDLSEAEKAAERAKKSGDVKIDYDPTAKPRPEPTATATPTAPAQSNPGIVAPAASPASGAGTETPAAVQTNTPAP